MKTNVVIEHLHNVHGYNLLKHGANNKPGEGQTLILPKDVGIRYKLDAEALHDRDGLDPPDYVCLVDNRRKRRIEHNVAEIHGVSKDEYTHLILHISSQKR